MIYKDTEIVKGFSDTHVKELSNHRKNGEFVVLWANGMRKPSLQGSFQPKVFLLTKSLSATGSLEEYEFFPVSVSNMTHITPGTIWKDGCLVGRVKNELHEFSLDNDSCEIIPLKDAIARYGSPPLMQHMLGKTKLLNVQMMDFHSSCGKRVLIPCIEYFLRGYGVSGELRRVLTTYNFESEGRERLLPSFSRRKNGPKWQIKKPGTAFNKHDRFFLANVKYNQVARSAAKQIYSSLEANFSNSRSLLAAMDVAPWYEGESSIRVEGEQLGSNCFWAWKVAGMSLPQCEDILFITERKKPAPKRDGGDIGGKDKPAAPKIYHQPPSKRDKSPSLLGDSPDIDGPSFLLEGELFQFIGDIPRTEFETVDNDVETGGGIKEQDDADEAGGGDRSGKGKGVGKAVTMQTIKIVDGVIFNLWNALFKMAEKYNSPQISNISWIDVSDGYVSTKSYEKPHLMSLEDIDEGENIDLRPLWGDKYSDESEQEKYLNSCKRWLSVFGDERCRGVSFFSMTINGEKYFIAEIERESVVVKNDTKRSGTQEKGYRGLIFCVDQDDEHDYISYLLDKVRFTKGMRPILALKCPGDADLFRHSTSATDEFKGESAIKNAFSKMGIKFKKPKNNSSADDNHGQKLNGKP